MGAKQTKNCNDSGTFDHVLPDGGHRDSPSSSNNKNRENEVDAVPEWDCVFSSDVVWEHKSDGHEWVNSYCLLEVWKEIDIMRHLYHRNVTILFEVLDDPVPKPGGGDPYICMVVEYMKGGPTMIIRSGDKLNAESGVSMLSDFVAPTDSEVYDEEEARVFLRDICRGVQYLHKQRIAHRDIKPDNVMVHEGGALRIVDFGCAVKFSESECDRGGMVNDTVGTLAFQSPESISAGEEGYSAFAADIWAVGVTLYVWVFGKLPFMAEGYEKLFESIRLDKLDIGEALGPELRYFLQRLLDKDPKTRITLEECLDHEWLKGVPEHEAA